MKYKFPAVILCCFLLLLTQGYERNDKLLETADHYFPLNASVSGLKADVINSAHMVLHNNVSVKHDSRVGNYLFFDGKDAWINSGGFENDCLYNPTECDNGYSVMLWLKYLGGRFLFSTGSYTTTKKGPGLEFIHTKRHDKLLWEVTSRMRKWRVKFPAKKGQWMHLVITWHKANGIKVYESGELLSEQNGSRATFVRSSDYLPVMTMGRPNSLHKLREYGMFGITTMVIWLRELNARDVLQVFKETLQLRVRPRSQRQYNVRNNATRLPENDVKAVTFNTVLQQQTLSTTTTTTVTVTVTTTTEILSSIPSDIKSLNRTTTKHGLGDTIPLVYPRNI